MRCAGEADETGKETALITERNVLLTNKPKGQLLAPA